MKLSRVADVSCPEIKAHECKFFYFRKVQIKFYWYRFLSMLFIFCFQHLQNISTTLILRNNIQNLLKTNLFIFHNQYIQCYEKVWLPAMKNVSMSSIMKSSSMLPISSESKINYIHSMGYNYNVVFICNMFLAIIGNAF